MTVAGCVAQGGNGDYILAPKAARGGRGISNLPSLRVTQLNGGGECTPAQ